MIFLEPSFENKMKITLLVQKTATAAAFAILVEIVIAIKRTADEAVLSAAMAALLILGR